MWSCYLVFPCQYVYHMRTITYLDSLLLMIMDVYFVSYLKKKKEEEKS